MNRVLLLAGIAFILTTPAAAAKDMLAQCLIDYPQKVDWCKSQYSSEARAAGEASYRELEEKIAAEYDDLKDLSDARKISPNHLTDRSIAQRIPIGQKLATNSLMGCFRFSPGEYRCVKSVFEKGTVVIAPKITGASAEYFDRNCPTLLRGLKSRECGFLVTFRVGARGVDHMEQVQIFETERMHLRRPGL